MNRPRELPRAPTEQRPIHDAREHIVGLVEPARKRMLRNVLKKKPKDELLDAIFEMVHLSDLLDYFREDLERHHAEC